MLRYVRRVAAVPVALDYHIVCVVLYIISERLPCRTKARRAADGVLRTRTRCAVPAARRWGEGTLKVQYIEFNASANHGMGSCSGARIVTFFSRWRESRDGAEKVYRS